MQGQVLSSGHPAPTHRVTWTFKTSFQAGKSPRTREVLSLPGTPLRQRLLRHLKSSVKLIIPSRERVVFASILLLPFF